MLRKGYLKEWLYLSGILFFTWQPLHAANPAAEGWAKKGSSAFAAGDFLQEAVALVLNFGEFTGERLVEFVELVVEAIAFFVVFDDALHAKLSDLGHETDSNGRIVPRKRW